MTKNNIHPQYINKIKKFKEVPAISKHEAANQSIFGYSSDLGKDDALSSVS